MQLKCALVSLKFENGFFTAVVSVTILGISIIILAYFWAV